MGSWWFLLLGDKHTELVGYFKNREECENYRALTVKAAKDLGGGVDGDRQYVVLPCACEEEDE